jgi:hypothetical protein
MASDEPGIEALEAELKRIGLTIDDLPGLVIGPKGIDDLIAHLRSLPSGATWRDVFPDLPSHWMPGQPDTWTTPYDPFGPYDYQELPTGPAVHIYWERAGDPVHLHELTAGARNANWPVYGAGLLADNAAWSTVHAMIVLARGTSEDCLHEFVLWLETQPGVRIAAIPRNGTEDYAA